MTNDSQQASVTTRVQKKAETRARILAAAIEVFIGGSVVTTPMEAVAKAAGVSKATLFFHFGSRPELLEAVGIELWSEGAHTTFRPSKPGLAPALRDYFAAQREPAARLLWEIGDVVSAAGGPGPDVAYRYLIAGIDARLADEGFDPSIRARLAGVVAPAALLVARRAAFDQADERELRRFLADVKAILAPWRPEKAT
jgi:AcrR family transcriptional regulator